MKNSFFEEGGESQRDTDAAWIQKESLRRVHEADFCLALVLPEYEYSLETMKFSALSLDHLHYGHCHSGPGRLRDCPNQKWLRACRYLEGGASGTTPKHSSRKGKLTTLKASPEIKFSWQSATLIIPRKPLETWFL